MACFDVFNGDADGLCALHQLRLAEPRDATLITGTKRDIALLARVPCAADAKVTVLDVSLERNRDALLALLQCGAQVDYFDHHYAGDVPQQPGLRAHLSADAQVCTSMLVDSHLDGAHRAWAVVGAFGDNLGESAGRLAASLDMPPGRMAALRELGECLNYNAYGDSETDLFMAPADLYRSMRRHRDPWRFIDHEPVLAAIRDGRTRDMALAQRIRPYAQNAGGRAYILPDAPWSRRVRGAWGNHLAASSPTVAHALLTTGADGTYVVSVRAPLNDLRGAEQLCRQFPTGGGRAAAAGIDQLKQERLADFVRAFDKMYSRRDPP